MWVVDGIFVARNVVGDWRFYLCGDLCGCAAGGGCGAGCEGCLCPGAGGLSEDGECFEQQQCDEYRRAECRGGVREDFDGAGASRDFKYLRDEAVNGEDANVYNNVFSSK